MKNNAKRIVCALLTAATCVTAVPVCSAVDVNVQDEVSGNEDYAVSVYSPQEIAQVSNAKVAGDLEYTVPEALADIGNIAVQRTIALNDDVAVALAVEFENPDEALDAVKAACPNLVSYMEDKYGIGELSSKNWQFYRDNLSLTLDDNDRPDWYTESCPEMNDEYATLDQFFDIYENTSENDELVKIAQEKNSLEELVNDEDFMYELPTNSEEELRDEAEAYGTEVASDSGIVLAASFSKTDAIDYAQDYAKERNTTNFPSYDKDCANFASQILRAGGKSDYKNWTCSKVAGHYLCGQAWTVADTFAKYWGVDYTYKTNKNFSKNLKKADCITYDKANDGKWDHIGFVTNVHDYDSSLGYCDYRVAQHTTDYILWARRAGNGWDTLKNKYTDAVYGIIRVA